MAYEPTLNPIGYTQLAYTAFPLGGMTFGYTISATPNLASPPLSGTSTTVAYTVSGTVFPNNNVINPTSTTLSAFNLSATPVSIYLQFGSNVGNQQVYGYVVDGSTSRATASSTVVLITFADPNFFATNIAISGNSTASVILTAGMGQFSTVLDNPFYSLAAPYTSVIGGLTSNNISFKTVNYHCRTWATQMG